MLTPAAEIGTAVSTLPTVPRRAQAPTHGSAASGRLLRMQATPAAGRRAEGPCSCHSGSGRRRPRGRGRLPRSWLPRSWLAAGNHGRRQAAAQLGCPIRQHQRYVAAASDLGPPTPHRGTGRVIARRGKPSTESPRRALLSATNGDRCHDRDRRPTTPLGTRPPPGSSRRPWSHRHGAVPTVMGGRDAPATVCQSVIKGAGDRWCPSTALAQYRIPSQGRTPRSATPSPLAKQHRRLPRPPHRRDQHPHDAETQLPHAPGRCGQLRLRFLQRRRRANRRPRPPVHC